MASVDQEAVGRAVFRGGSPGIRTVIAVQRTVRGRTEPQAKLEILSGPNQQVATIGRVRPSSRLKQAGTRGDWNGEGRKKGAAGCRRLKRSVVAAGAADFAFATCSESRQGVRRGRNCRNFWRGKRCRKRVARFWPGERMLKWWARCVTGRRERRAEPGPLGGAGHLGGG